MLTSLRLEGNVEGSLLNKKSDEELLREVRYAQIHSQEIDRQKFGRGLTPEPVAESSGTQGDPLGSFGLSPLGGKNLFSLLIVSPLRQYYRYGISGMVTRPRGGILSLGQQSMDVHRLSADSCKIPGLV